MEISLKRTGRADIGMEATKALVATMSASMNHLVDDLVMSTMIWSFQIVPGSTGCVDVTHIIYKNHWEMLVRKWPVTLRVCRERVILLVPAGNG